MSLNSEKPPNPPTIIKPLSIYPLFFLNFTSVIFLCCNFMYRKSIYLPVWLQWSFFSWKIGLHLRMSCINLHTLQRIFHPTFCIWTKDCTRCLLTVLHTSEEKRERKAEEEGAAGKEVLILLGVKVICWTMTCAWRHHTHRTKEWTSQLVLRTALCYHVCVHMLGQRSCSFYEATDLFWEHDTQSIFFGEYVGHKIWKYTAILRLEFCDET